jgi:cyclase
VGSQACVIGIDAKRRYLDNPKENSDKIIVETEKGYCWYDCSIYGGREFTGIDAISWSIECQERGAGEILLTSMDRDGTKDGYDIPLTRTMSEMLDIPIIASGGGGNPEHIYEAFTKGKADAALAASIFHYNEYPVPVVKEYLKDKGVSVRYQ